MKNASKTSTFRVKALRREVSATNDEGSSIETSTFYLLILGIVESISIHSFLVLTFVSKLSIAS
jgi:hypothetical protein